MEPYVPEDSDVGRIVPQTLLDGRYRLVELVAVGGTGEVWKATDELLDHRVAVKVLKHRYARDVEIRARFRAEARHATVLSHPGIARVHDYGEQDGIGYLVMEFLSGEALSQILRRERLDTRATMEVIGQVARAIQVAHDAGVIHRDIKPANLIVSPDGVTKVTDFGTARLIDADTMTQPGMVVGTALYMSPEQAQGLELSISTDIYSLGVVAYECLTGDPPFTAMMPAEVAFAHIHDRPARLPDDVPAEAAALVLRCLAKDPEQRPASMAELAQMSDRVRGLSRGRHGTVRTPRPTREAAARRRPPRTATRRPAGARALPRPTPQAGGRGALIGTAALSAVLVSGVVFGSTSQMLPMAPFSDEHRPPSSESTTASPNGPLRTLPARSNAATPAPSGSPTASPSTSPTTSPSGSSTTRDSTPTTHSTGKPPPDGHTTRVPSTRDPGTHPNTPPGHATTPPDPTPTTSEPTPTPPDPTSTADDRDPQHTTPPSSPETPSHLQRHSVTTPSEKKPSTSTDDPGSP